MAAFKAIKVNTATSVLVQLTLRLMHRMTVEAYHDFTGPWNKSLTDTLTGTHV